MYRFAVITALLIAAVGGIIAPAAVGVAAAQEGSEDAADDESDDSREDTVLHELGPDDDPKAYITDYEWDGRTVSVTIEAEEYTTVSVTDAGAFVGISEGDSREVPFETYTVPSETTRTIEFTVADGTGARAISVAAHGTMIGIVETGVGGPFSGDVGWAVVRAGVAAAALVVGGTALVTSTLTWYAMRRDYRRVI